MGVSLMGTREFRSVGIKFGNFRNVPKFSLLENSKFVHIIISKIEILIFHLQIYKMRSSDAGAWLKARADYKRYYCERGRWGSKSLLYAQIGGREANKRGFLPKFPRGPTIRELLKTGNYFLERRVDHGCDEETA